MADNGKSNHTVIKKYANRRLYHTGTSTYVTLEDLATMVQNGEDFLVYDARSGDDITRSVLTQIIFEQENKAGEDNLLPVAFLRQLIRFYGDSMRTMVPSFLEFSMANFARDQEGLREKMAQSFAPTAFQSAMEEQVRANMSFFGDAMKMFTTFGTGPLSGMGAHPSSAGKSGAGVPAPVQHGSGGSDLDDLKRQMAEMQSRLEDLAKK
jgi:polyhydroxyalkanoate synthesis repressor PhaR